ncbi:MAG: biotin/lipoyl-containing protein, partial [Pseudomonadota bacterium]|nr:biotin/lipoyl-containing protein [Pseudomonadota bacterium]
AGASVSKGDLLLIMEAMKMEHRITAPRDGVVASVHVAVGDQVDNGQLLVSMAEE